MVSPKTPVPKSVVSVSKLSQPKLSALLSPTTPEALLVAKGRTADLAREDASARKLALSKVGKVVKEKKHIGNG
jgi:hypothetical protein